MSSNSAHIKRSNVDYIYTEGRLLIITLLANRKVTNTGRLNTEMLELTRCEGVMQE